VRGCWERRGRRRRRPKRSWASTPEVPSRTGMPVSPPLFCIAKLRWTCAESDHGEADKVTKLFGSAIIPNCRRSRRSMTRTAPFEDGARYSLRCFDRIHSVDNNIKSIDGQDELRSAFPIDWPSRLIVEVEIVTSGWKSDT